MAKPLRPEDAAAAKLAVLPEEVIEVFNDLIAVHFDGHCAKVDQNDVVSALLSRDVVSYAQEVFSRHLLDVESVYVAAGWIVSYEKPGYNEAGATYFIFE
jgi:hypothetical protein